MAWLSSRKVGGLALMLLFFNDAPSRIKRDEVMKLFGGESAFKAFHLQQKVNNQDLSYCLIEAN